MTSHPLDHRNEIIAHYERCWHSKPVSHTWKEGPTHKLPYNFSILEFSPRDGRNMWTYATCCMSQPEDASFIELHLFSSVKDERLVELLTTVAYYHRNTANLNLDHTVNFGKPWQGKSLCDHGLISLPYLDGPELENLNSAKFYWLIPITKDEVAYKMKYGIGALEDLFEEKKFDYINASRKGVV